MQYILCCMDGLCSIVCQSCWETVHESVRLKIEPKIQNGQIIIDIKDPDGIKDIVINLNGVVYQAKDVNQKSVRIPLKPVTGVNTLKVTVTNVNSLVSEGTTEINYAQ